MNIKLSTIFFNFLLLVILPFKNFPQSVETFGFKSGVTIAWQSEVLSDEYEVENIEEVYGHNFGFFINWYNAPIYNLNSELYFSQKGRSIKIIFTDSEHPDGTGEFVKNEININYLSILLYPRLYSEIYGMNLYALAGPRIDLEISSSSTTAGPEPSRSYYSEGYENIMKKSNNLLFGITFGIGIQFKDILPYNFGLEIRYNPDVSKIYESEFHYNRNYSIDLLIALEI